jgi:DNA ligase-1
MKKPMLASDAIIEKIRFPCLVQVKIDGLRCLHTTGKLTGRSLKIHKNRYINNFFGDMLFDGFDGEMIVGTDPTAEDLCRMTSSAIGSYEGSHHFTWNIFDHINEKTKHLGYEYRIAIAQQKIVEITAKYPMLRDHLALIDSFECVSMNDLLTYEEDFLDLGYEGLIIRDPNGLYKEGRSTVREGGLLRIKRFIEEEAIVIGVSEGQHNGNEALINELGLTYRTSHQANKIGNGMVATMQAELVKDVHDSLSKKLLFNKGQVINITAGSLTHDERKYYWENKHEIIGKVIKFKSFPKGVKNKPRFPNFVSFRSKEDS